MPSQTPATPSQTPATTDDFRISVGGFPEGEYRVALFKIIEQQGFSFVGNTPNSDARDYHSIIRDGAAYVGLIGQKYGPIPEVPSLNPNRLSLTELEFNEAMKLNRPVVLFVQEAATVKGDVETDSEKRKKLEAFRARARELDSGGRFHVSFRGPTDFEEKAFTAIARLREHLIERLNSAPQYQQAYDSAPLRKGFQQSPPPEKQSMRPEPPAQETVGTEKRLIFFSASHEDYGWRDRLKAALEKSSDEVEWWDDSRIIAGSKGLAEIDAAIARATVAVVLLSPAYLNSETATNELNRLLQRASSGKLRLFPIMLYRSPWNAMPPAVRDLQIWAMAKPVAELRGTAAKNELQKIADSIVQASREFRRSESAASPDRKPAPEPIFSGEARKVLDLATALASKSGRGGVTSSCLLFALAERAKTENNTERFVRDALERSGDYAAAFHKFLSDSDNSPRQSESQVRGWEAKTSKNVTAILENAARIASRVSRATPEIFPRHIFAAMLVTAEGQTQAIARTRLRNLGIDLEPLSRDFLEFIRTEAPSEDQAGWAAILTSKGFQGGPAGYTSEFCGVGGTRPVEDQLDVKDWAYQLADLIALRETKLPLAIGLFGNWGSGKSHFMNLIDRRLKWLMDREKERANGGSGRWCSQIVPVYFNAWHYLDANLWASLIAQIFDSLFAHLRPRVNDLEKVQALLEKASGAAARAAEEVIVAQTATKQAQRELIAAEQSRLQQETARDGLLEGLRKLLPSTQELEKQAVELLGIKKEMKSIDDVRQVVNEAHSLAGRAKAVWLSLWQQPGRRWRLAWLFGTILGGAAIATIAAMYLPATQVKLLMIGRQIAAVLATVTPFVLWLRPLLVTAGNRLKQMEDWASRAQAEQQGLRETPEVKQAQLNVAEATAKEDAAKIRLAEAKTREEQLKEDAKNLSPERKLGRFIEQRAQSMDYRGQLGLVSLARRDFQELSDIFADSEALKDKLEKLKATHKQELKAEAEEIKQLNTSTNGQAVKDEIDKLEASHNQKLKEEEEQIKELSRSIDRIVLFVDDLDRCQPEKVVEVLQAVHLLLAFPLFAVVVGVDQRCLRQSLRMQFKGLLSPEDGSGNGANGGLNIDKDGGEDERPATPLDYLEKIFHVPFHLPPMGDKGFEKLIDRLTEPSEIKIIPPPPADSQKAAETAKGEVPRAQEKQEEAKAELPVPDKSAKDGDDKKPDLPADEKRADTEQVLEKPIPVTTEVIGSVPLQRWEREALRAYHPLIQTPRGATRLLNTYRLVRASIPQSEWAEFSGAGASDGEFRVAMLLLAAAAGYPAVARLWFERLLNVPPSELFLQEDGADADPAWLQFKKVYDATFAHITTPLTTELFAKWVDRVERFAF